MPVREFSHLLTEQSVVNAGNSNLHTGCLLPAHVSAAVMWVVQCLRFIRRSVNRMLVKAARTQCLSC